MLPGSLLSGLVVSPGLRMRIGIDAHILGKKRGGVESCVLSIIRSLAELDHHNDYFLYVTKRHSLQAGELPANFHLRYLPAAPRWVERFLLIPYFYRADRLDVIHIQRV